MGPGGKDQYNVNVTQMVEAEKGLNLKAVGELLNTVKTAEEFEKALNDPNVGINNLDLNADGRVDYLSVTEFGEGNLKGFSISSRLENGELQEVATIKIEKETEDSGKVEVAGNPTIYGHNNYYHSPFSGSGFLWGYLFASAFNRPWISPYGYGAYPSHYRPYRTRGYSDYNNRIGRYTNRSTYSASGTSTIGNRVKSPHRGQNASSVRAKLRNPTDGQKKFQMGKAQRVHRQRRSSGFGRSGYSTRRSRSGGFRFGK